MSVNLFAAIHIGSYELTMKICEYSKKNGIKQIEYIRHGFEMNFDHYSDEKLRIEDIDVVCNVLKNFKRIMDGYHVTEYRAYATSAMRESRNVILILEQIRVKTGLNVVALTNSEHRLLNYKAFVNNMEDVYDEKDNYAGLLDIDGNNMQISIFDGACLKTTQKLRLGLFKIKEKVWKYRPKLKELEEMVDELFSDQLENIKKLHMNNGKMKKLIITDDYFSHLFVTERLKKEGVPIDEFTTYMQGLNDRNLEAFTEKYNLNKETLVLFCLLLLVIKKITKVFRIEVIMNPRITVCDGIAYEYAYDNKYLKDYHDFESDILSATRYLNEKYMVDIASVEDEKNSASLIFKAMKKVHGLDNRAGFLLSIAALLHETGKYINISNVGESSYDIVMQTELIGLSHIERKIIANVCKYNYMEFGYSEEILKDRSIDIPAYLVIAKLTAILRISSAIHKSNKQKYRDIKVVVKDNELIITVDTDYTLMIESGMILERKQFFEEVFGITVVFKEKRKK